MYQEPTSRGTRPRPLRIAVVNDYEVIVRGLAAMLAAFPDRVLVVETIAGGVAGDTTDDRVDVALFDTFGGHRTILGRARQMVQDRQVGHVALYTWTADASLLTIARSSGVSGVLSKASTADQLVGGLERVARGEQIGFDVPIRVGSGPVGSDPAPGARSAGMTPRARRLDQLSEIDLQARLTPREQEVLALLGLGLSNRDIAEEMFLGVETVRTYVRQVYQKLGVKNRTQAAVRARSLGLEPADERRSAAS